MGIPIPRQVYIETVPNIFVHSWRISINIPYTDSFKPFTSIDGPISFRFVPYFRVGTVKDAIDRFVPMTIQFPFNLSDFFLLHEPNSLKYNF